MRAWLLLSCFSAVPLGTQGCKSGQTGSPDCPASESCVCAALDGTILLTGTLASFEAQTATVLVTGWVSPAELRDDLVLGDTVGGAVRTTLGCGSDPASTPAVGEEVFVAYERGGSDRYPDCAEYRTCTTTKCGAPPTHDDGSAWDACDGQCVTDSRSACSAHRAQALVTGNLVVLPKTDPQVLGDEPVPAAELAEFHQREVCESRLPPPPAEACDDTVEMATCSMSPEPGRSPSWMLWPLLILAFVLARRRPAGA